MLKQAIRSSFIKKHNKYTSTYLLSPVYAMSTEAREFPKSRVYTKTGDKGTSTLYNMKRSPKDSAHFQALGDVDELNGNIGLAAAHAMASKIGIEDRLTTIQSVLFDLGACIATPVSSSTPQQLERTKFDATNVQTLENWIDEMDSMLPPLRNFILPSGGLASAQLHVCRSVCRRAERSVVPLARDGDVDDAVAIYLNRLSDFLFIAARFCANQCGSEEHIYKKPNEVVIRKLEPIAIKKE